MNNMTHKSSLGSSQGTTSISNWQELDILSDEELVNQVNTLKRQINILNLENEILEKNIIRKEPLLMNGVYQALEIYSTKVSSNNSFHVSSFMKSQISKFGLVESIQASPSKLHASASRASHRRAESFSALISGTIIHGQGPKINVNERSELVSAEMNIVIKNLEKVRQRAAEAHALLKAQLEEIGIRVTDIEKASKSFNQAVLVDGWDKIAQRIPAEIWIRFITDWGKKTDKQIGKLRLRTSTLNTQYAKCKGQIRDKRELSQNLRPVDFDKLEIENSVCLKGVEQKLQQLEELKKMTGDANLTLAIHKKALMDQNNYLDKVLVTKKEKMRLTIQLDKECELIQLQVNILSERLNKIKKVRAAYKVPDILDYVKVKGVVTDQKRDIKRLENRLHIYQIALSSTNKKLHSLVDETSSSSWSDI